MIREKILEMMREQVQSLTPVELERTVREMSGLGRDEAKSLVRSMVSDRELAYADRYGRTVIEISWNRAVRVSERIILAPPRVCADPRPGDAVVRLEHGASFGTGHHPTTRMALRGVDYALSQPGFFQPDMPSQLLDIGTGSGVLALAAIALGVQEGTGLDLDPCAVNEARINAGLNEMADRFSAGDTPLEYLAGPFLLVTANLRYPTLRQIYPEILRLSAANGALVISGIKTGEIPGLTALYSAGFELRHQEIEKGWAALVFRCLSKEL